MNQQFSPIVYIVAGILVIAMACLSVVANLAAGVYDMRLVTGFVLMFAGILLIWVGIRNRKKKDR